LLGGVGLFLLGVLAFPGMARGQFFDSFNPKVSTEVMHPPGFGITGFKRVALLQSSQRGSECLDLLFDRLVQLFVSHEIETIDRQHLDAILAERNMSLGSSIDRETATRLGELLGPTVLVFLKVSRCATEQKALYRDEERYAKGGSYPVRVYISRTQAYLNGSLQAVDLATGRILKAWTFSASPSRENKSEGGQPEFPSEYDLQDQAIGEVVSSASRMFFPWPETLTVYYYDDKDCNMRAAYMKLKGGDKEGALKQSLENLEQCKTDPKAKQKHVGRAYYNVGVSYFLLNEFDKALEALDEAYKLYPYNIVSDALAACQRAKQEAEAFKQFEEKAAAIESGLAEKPASEKAQAGQKQGSPGSTKGKESGKEESIEERLKKLDSLCKQGLLSKEECAKKRAEILKSL